MLTTITARRLITDTGEVEYPVISVEDGHIVRIESGDANGSKETLAPLSWALALDDIGVLGFAL